MGPAFPHRPAIPQMIPQGAQTDTNRATETQTPNHHKPSKTRKTQQKRGSRTKSETPQTQSKALYLVEAPVAAFNGQLPNNGLIRLTRGASHTNECSLFLAERLDMVRTLQAGSDLGYDNRFAVHIMHGDVRNNQRLAAIDDGIRNGIHHRKHFVFGNASHAKRLVFDAEHQASALSIGKRHRGFGVVDAPGGRSELVFHILGFAAQQCFNAHTLIIFHMSKPFSVGLIVSCISQG